MTFIIIIIIIIITTITIIISSSSIITIIIYITIITIFSGGGGGGKSHTQKEAHTRSQPRRLHPLRKAQGRKVEATKRNTRWGRKFRSVKKKTTSLKKKILPRSDEQVDDLARHASPHHATLTKFHSSYAAQVFLFTQMEPRQGLNIHEQEEKAARLSPLVEDYKKKKMKKGQKGRSSRLGWILEVSSIWFFASSC